MKLPPEIEPYDADRLALGDLLNRVLDKGVVIAGDVTISIADIDLVRVGVNLVIASVESELQRDVSVLPPPRGD